MESNRFEKLLLLLLIAALTLTQLHTFEKLFIRWNQGDNNYCFLIMPLFLYLCWERRFDGQRGFRFDRFEWSRSGLVIILLACGFMLLGKAGSIESILYTGLYLSILGIVLCIYGRRTRHLAFPLLVLAFLIPMPPFINRILTFKLKIAATTIAVKLLRLADISVLQTGNIIDLGLSRLQVVDACSGLRYFVPLILLAILIGYFFNQGLWRRLFLVAIVPPLSIVVNAFRIFISGWLTVNGHREMAQNFFHDFSGWVIFMVASAILLGCSMVLKNIGTAVQATSLVDTSEPPKGGIMRPLSMTTAACLLLIICGFAAGLSPTAAKLPDRLRLDSLPMVVGPWQGHQQFLSKEIMAELWADDYVSAVFQRANQPNRIQFFVPFYEYQSTRHTVHAPQACLLGGGFDVLKTEDRLFNTGNGREIQIRTLLLKQGDTRILGSYFFLGRGRVITSVWMNKFYLLWDAITRQRTDGALVRAELLMVPGQTEEEAYIVLSDFLREIWEILPQYVPD